MQKKEEDITRGERRNREEEKGEAAVQAARH